jgi:hypothetical protein
MPVTASVFLARAVAGQNGSVAHVLRLAADGHTVEKVAVVSGEVLDDRIRIVSGLKAGDSVVVAGAAAIVPGTRVTPMQLREGLTMSNLAAAALARPGSPSWPYWPSY